MSAFFEPFAHAQKNLELYPTHPLWNVLPIVQLDSVPIREMRRLGRDTIIYPPVKMIPGLKIRDGLGPGRLVKSYDMTSLQTCTLPYCRYAGIVLMEDQIVSNILIDWHMFVKPFIHKALDYK